MERKSAIIILFLLLAIFAGMVTRDHFEHVIKDDDGKPSPFHAAAIAAATQPTSQPATAPTD